MNNFKEIFQTDKVGYKGHISYNLHNHTEYSDGEHSVEELIKEAKSKIITHLSITDHDNILAYTDGNAMKIAKDNGISSRHFRDLIREKYNFSDKKIKEITGVNGGSDTHYKHGKKLNLRNLYLTDIFNKNK